MHYIYDLEEKVNQHIYIYTFLFFY